MHIWVNLYCNDEKGYVFLMVEKYSFIQMTLALKVFLRRIFAYSNELTDYRKLDNHEIFQYTVLLSL